MEHPRKKRPVERRGYRVGDWCEAYDTSRSQAYRLMAEGRLRYVMLAGRRFIPNEAAEALICADETN